MRSSRVFRGMLQFPVVILLKAKYYDDIDLIENNAAFYFVFHLNYMFWP